MGILKDKVVIVTGGANGIGRATSLLCAREGAKLVIADIDVEGGTLTEKLITDTGGEAMFVETDVTWPLQIDELIGCATTRFGHIDAAFNNAGIEGIPAPIDKSTEDNWRRVLDVNLTSIFNCLRLEVSAIAQSGGGSIVNCASVAGLVGFEGSAAYVASKHGIVGLTKAAALDLAQRHIRVNAVCPGVVDTDMITRITRHSAEVQRDMALMQPMGRMGHPQEIGELVAWLLSDRASFITGQAIAADGGLVAR